MLNRLLRGAEDTSLYLFTVDQDCSEVKLLNQFLNNSTDTVVVLTDRLDGVSSTNLRSYRLTDYVGFDTDASASVKEVLKVDIRKSETVVVKSLTGLLDFFTPVAVARWIKDLQSRCKCVYAVIHEDCVDQEVSSQIRKLFTTVIRIGFVEEIRGGENRLCSILHRKPGGKLQRSCEVYSFKSGNIHIEPFTKKVVEVDEEDEDLTDKLTTFKIGTKETEDTARKNLILPFYKDEQIKGFKGEVKIQGEKNKIYYEPDSGDDWDDEDPDDDLDI